MPGIWYQVVKQCTPAVRIPLCGCICVTKCSLFFYSDPCTTLTTAFLLIAYYREICWNKGVKVWEVRFNSRYQTPCWYYQSPLLSLIQPLVLRYLCPTPIYNILSTFFVNLYLSSIKGDLDKIWICGRETWVINVLPIWTKFQHLFQGYRGFKIGQPSWVILSL